MFKPFSLIFFIAVMVWLGSIFISSEPQVRMDRTCEPVHYMDKAATAGMQLIDAGWGTATHQFFENVHYGCRYVLWRMFYADDWNKAQQGLGGLYPNLVRPSNNEQPVNQKP